MSLLFLSNSAPNYHFFFNQLALNFLNEGIDTTCAVDSRYSRNTNHVDSVFSKVYCFSDFFLSHKTDKSIIDKYKEYNLNYALLSDFERSQYYNISPIWKTKQTEKLKSALLCFFEKIIKERNINCIIYENISNTFSYFSYIVASHLGIKYCGMTSSRLPGRFEIHSSPHHDFFIDQKISEIMSGDFIVDSEIRDLCQQYLLNIDKTQPDYMSFNNLSDIGVLKRYFNWKKCRFLFHLFLSAFGNNGANFQIGNPLITYLSIFLRNIKRRIKCIFIRYMYQQSIEGDSFILYPLHFHPESSTSILAGNNLDEYEVIRSLAFNLPEGINLYVKDHMSAWGFPSFNFYKKIKQLPNVTLLAPWEPAKKLIKQSKGVATLTSTVGYEALLLGKPVMIFGRVFYECHCNAYPMSSKDKIFDTLNSMLTDDKKVSDDYNLAFVQAYWISTLPGKLNMIQSGAAAKNHADAMFETIKQHIMQQA